MGLNLKHAQYIMEIIKEGSITNASKTMHVSQPALSQTIKAVEKYLGAPIFLRNTKPIVLTEAGKKYIAAVKKIITISTNLLHEVSDIQYEGYGTLRLGIPIQRAMQMLPRVMPVFRQRYPHHQTGNQGSREQHYGKIRPQRRCRYCHHDDVTGKRRTHLRTCRDRRRRTGRQQADHAGPAHRSRCAHPYYGSKE